MQKLYSQLIGLPVFDEYSPVPITLVRDVLVDPENGKLIAFVVKNQRIIVPLDVARVGNGLYIKDREHIVAMDDVLRVTLVAKQKIKIIGARVITQHQKTYLGRVVDFEIDTRSLALSALHVAKTYLFFRFQEKIIPFHAIVRINQETIIVKDARAAVPLTEKEKATSASSAYAA